MVEDSLIFRQALSQVKTMNETFPELEEKLNRLVEQALNNVISNSSSLLNNITRSRYFEGNKSLIRQPSGKEEETEKKHFSEGTEIPVEKILYGSIKNIFEHYKQAAVAMAYEQEKSLLESIDRTVQNTGNVVDAKGQHLSPETILQLMEMVEINFTEDGKSITSSFACSPSLSEKLQPLLDDLVKTKEYKELIERKRSEWRDREANRTLVG